MHKITLKQTQQVKTQELPVKDICEINNVVLEWRFNKFWLVDIKGDTERSVNKARKELQKRFAENGGMLRLK